MICEHKAQHPIQKVVNMIEIHFEVILFSMYIYLVTFTWLLFCYLSTILRTVFMSLVNVQLHIYSKALFSCSIYFNQKQQRIDRIFNVYSLFFFGLSTVRKRPFSFNCFKLFLCSKSDYRLDG